IDSAVLLALPFAPDARSATAEASALSEKSEGRLRPAATVDPTQGADAVAEALAAWSKVRNLAAVKLYPGYRAFYPNDVRLEPVYEFAAHRKLPVMLHQGDTMDPSGLVKFARPIELDEVAVRYRDVRFVLCHMGNPWMEEAAEIVYKNANVYADTSGLLASPRAPYYPRMFERAQRRLYHAIVTVGDPQRILYGSDWPLESIRSAVALVSGLDLPEEHREGILGKNALTLFSNA
ncbi:MAG: amidohydrolase family protein, partial [Thermoplasmata archaeon]